MRWRAGLPAWLADQVSLYEEHGWGWAWYAYREWQGMNLELSAVEAEVRPPASEPEHLRVLKALLRGRVRERDR